MGIRVSLGETCKTPCLLQTNCTVFKVGTWFRQEYTAFVYV